MKNLQKLIVAALLFASVNTLAQNQSTSAASNPSVRPIAESDMMYRKTVWRTVDLREKQNKPLFADNRQITKVIIEAVKSGALPIYKNDSLTSTLTREEFLANMTMAGNEDEIPQDLIDMGFGQPDKDDWGDAVPTVVDAGPVSNEYFPKDLYQLEIKEDVIFDKKRSRMYYDIKAMTLVVPASLKANIRGRDIAVGTFKYSDLARVFREQPTKALWINPHNDAQHKNLADAFDLRLFSSFITKVSNPDNASLEDIYGGPQQGILAAQQAAGQMLEYEYNLWSF